MSAHKGTGVTDAGRVVFAAEIHPHRGGLAPPLLVDRFSIVESPLEGWTGYAKVEPGGAGGILEGAGMLEAFDAMVDRYLSPGSPVLLGLWLIVREAGTAKAHGLRHWPSVVTKLTTTTEENGSLLCHVHFSDTVTYLAQRRIWCLFRGCSLSQAIGGAIELANDGLGRPVASPDCGSLPPVSIHEHLRESLGRLPYVVASGETLGTWLARVLGRFGVRMEMLGRENGTISASLKDGPPGGKAVQLTFGAGPASSLNAVLKHTVMRPPGLGRDAVLDNPSSGPVQRTGDVGAVGTLVTSAGADLEEAGYSGALAEQYDDVSMAGATVVTGQSGIWPGSRVEFNRPVSGAICWQAARTSHGYADGSYFNTVEMVKDGAAWRPRPRNAEGVSLVTGVVNGGRGASPGTVVNRDRLGRIPVSLHLERAMSDTDDDAVDALPGLMVPVADPIAGGAHGFVPEHRDGDRCRLAVHSPTDLEVVGFLFDDHRRIPESVADGTMGLVVNHDAADGAGKWSGMLFRPDADDDRDEPSSGDGTE